MTTKKTVSKAVKVSGKKKSESTVSEAKKLNVFGKKAVKSSTKAAVK